MLLSLLISLVILLSGCESVERAIIEDEYSYDFCKESLVGKWQLSAIVDQTDLQPATTTYFDAKDNIIFDFRNDSVLFVNKEIDFIMKGEYGYFYGGRQQHDASPYVLWSGYNFYINLAFNGHYYSEGYPLSCVFNKEGDQIMLHQVEGLVGAKSYYFKLSSNND